MYDSTGKITDMAESFTKEYGIKATGVKMKAGEQLDVVSREAQSKNVRGDVYLNTDVSAIEAELVPQGYVVSWFPPDLKDEVPAQYQSPAVITQEANVWAYNTELADSCPVKNIWDLTDAKWKGHLSFQDPLLKSDYMYWFNQWAMHADDKIAKAYETKFGEPLKTDEDSATAEWVKRLAANEPLVTKSDDDAATTAGAPGQKDQFLAFISTAKFRDNDDAGLKLGLCKDIDPFSGRAYQKAAVIASGTKSPNAAKLFVHYVYTKDGIAPQTADGKFSTNSTVPPADDEPSGVGDIWDQIYQFDATTAKDDYEALPEWQDFWRVNG
ncbi:ABC transporter substrate-binding protein [Microbacterium elymi]|uniref:ABC transporter substrate-binding protein n=1 Tax=Microbacterium elymi TaxID=2909587 RepID=A0ABY5NH92_9MICO|nr:ABC transporter substrate-binding protein [Microbacterium elymi]UUT34542.1 ABC transporter substrate-binding protein [Microbacterium elymi]